MAMLRTILHGLCVTCVTPAELLQNANRQLMNQSKRYDGTFVTACFLVFDPADGSLQYSTAGHNPPLVVDRAAAVRELEGAQSLPLAVDINASYTVAESRLNPLDTLLLYTDGITEATNASGEFYGRERLLSCVSEDVPNAQHIIDCVTHKLLAFTGSRDQEDDRTLVAMRLLEGT
jgi:sigma-B regulation protein RsbU (phosphoserine phosphatase)